MVNFQRENAPVPSDLAAFSLSLSLKIDQWSIFKKRMHLYPPIWRRFRSFFLWKSTNGPFSKRECTCTLRFGGVFAHSLFENRSMVHFQRENAPVPSDLAAFSLILSLKIDQWSIFKERMHLYSPIWRPSRFFTLSKSTNDRFWKRECTCTLRFGGLFAHFLFQNRPMIDFERGSAPVPSDLAAFWRSTRSQRVFLKENSHFLQDRPHLKNG